MAIVASAFVYRGVSDIELKAIMDMSDLIRSSSGSDYSLLFNSGAITVEEINYFCATYEIY